MQSQPWTALPMNRPNPNPSQEGNSRGADECLLPPGEGSGAGCCAKDRLWGRENLILSLASGEGKRSTVNSQHNSYG